MRRTSSSGSGMTLSLPPFTPVVTWLLGINTAVYLMLLLLGQAAGGLMMQFVHLFWLMPASIPGGLGGNWSVTHGAVWQLVTYSFLHLEFRHWFGNMLGIWMFGSTMESHWGSRRFTELFGVGVIGAALTSVAVSFSGVLGSPYTPTIGASGGAFAILIAYGILFADNEIMMIPFPFMIKAKYVVAILIVVTLVFALQDRGGVAYIAHLGGLLTGYLYTKFVPRGGFSFALTEGMYGFRNNYYKWKRRRAAKKFEVYMRKHKKEDFFDEYGNYKGPAPDDKGNGENRGPWVN